MSLYQFRPQCFTLTITKAYLPMLPLLHSLSSSIPSILLYQYCFQSTQTGACHPRLKNFQCLSIKWVSQHNIKGLLQSERILPFWPHLSPFPVQIASSLSTENVLFCFQHITLFITFTLFNYCSLYLRGLLSRVSFKIQLKSHLLR